MQCNSKRSVFQLNCTISLFRSPIRFYTFNSLVNIIDAIGGWTTEGIGHQYGQGHSLTVMHGWMERLTTKVKEP